MIGYLGVDQNGCEANGCCWNPKDVSYLAYTMAWLIGLLYCYNLNDVAE